MDEDAEDIPGEELDPILKGPHGAPVAQALIGCLFYRDDPDDLSKILTCDRNAGRLTIRCADGRTRLVDLAAGYILISPVLRAAYDAAITPEQRAEQQMRNTIAAFGFPGHIEQQDLAPLKAAIACARAGHVPPVADRKTALRLAEKYGPPQVIAKLASAWVDADRSVVLPDVLIVLLPTLRHAGYIEQACERSEILQKPGLQLRPDQARVLFTERAALLADRYEHRRDPQLLAAAWAAARRSWAHGPSDHCRHVFERLKRLECEAQS